MAKKTAPEATKPEETAPKATKATTTKKAVATPSASPKNDTIKKFQRSAKDTGSTAVQIAILSEKINQLSKHLTDHKKDHDSRMGLLKMISHRRGLLGYLEKRQPDDYRKLIASLGLRK